MINRSADKQEPVDTKTNVLFVSASTADEMVLNTLLAREEAGPGVRLHTASSAQAFYEALYSESSFQVIVVDDQQAYRDAAKFVIEMSEGFELVGTAASGEEGLCLVGALSPDLVLMDINLPGINGLEATRRITSTHTDTAVIVFSTHSAADYAFRAREAGAIGFIAKADLGPDALRQLWSQHHSDWD